MKEECKCTAWVLRDKSRRAKDQLEQRLAGDAKSNKKGGYKYVNSILQGKTWVDCWKRGQPSDGWLWKRLNAFFASIFIGQTCFKPLHMKTAFWEGKEQPAVREEKG